jgi:diguanylate cyclase (GGDEF)-like protein/PAS domain S-box-containing protein
VKQFEALKNALSQRSIRSALYISWGLLSIMFAIYAASTWLQTSDRLLTQLDSMSQLIAKNTQQHTQFLYSQFDTLEQRLKQESDQLNLANSINQFDRIGYDHSFLINRQGQLIATTFTASNTIQLALKQTLLSAETLQAIRSQDRITFAPTFSLGIANSSQYVPVCKVSNILNSSILCLALSTENELFNWHRFNNINGTSIEIIDDHRHLLYADPLPMHRRSLLGKKIATKNISAEINLTAIREQGYFHFTNQLGLDGTKRLGVTQYLAQSNLFVVISMPMTKGILLWLQQISAPFIILLAFFIISYLLASVSTRLFKQAEANQKVAEVTLIEQKNTLQLLFSNLPGIIYRVRIPDYKVLFITDGCRELLGYSTNVYLSGRRTPFDDIHEEDQELLVKHAACINNQQNNYEHVFRIKNPNGELKWVMDRGRAVKDSDNSQAYLEGTLVDITEHILSQQQVEFLATRDPLTELANRYLFNDELINHIDRFRDDTCIALLFIDLDRFKTINDSLGHQVGDRLLKLVAQRLKDCIDENILLARLGGDEFMVMMKDPSDIAAVEALAHNINTVISKTYELDYYKLNTSCSIGISMYPQDSLESHILLRNADTAMYSAKAKGGNRYQFYTDEMNKKVNSRLTIETELRRAIKENEFEVHYQPQINAHTGELEGAEALVRWIHPTAGMVSPIEFIPIAEETGLIREIGDWVLNQACITFQQWNLESQLNLSVAVNISVIQLDDSFVLRVQEILRQSGFDKDNLELEITESLLMDNVQENIRILENINRQGVRFAMDDFGTGYSSLSYLRQFPISKLKIDRSFVNDITNDSDDEAIIKAIIAMGQTLKLKVIAEGVENHQQLVLLQSMGCDSYQGYYFSKPLAEKEFYEKYIQPAVLNIKKNQWV